MSTDHADDPDETSGTTETDYRWQWLSTLWAIGYGFGLPAWIASPLPFDIGAGVLATLLLAWGATVVYIVGPENVKAWQSLRGGGG